MFKVKNNEAGITISALIIMIVILLIIAAITVHEGKDIIKDVKVETLQTNMLAIKAKAKSYAEEVEAETWSKEDADKSAIYESKYHMIPRTIGPEEEEQLDSKIPKDKYDSYEVTAETLKEMGLNELKEDLEGVKRYVIVYDADNYSNMDVVYTGGITYKKVTYYTLSALQSVYNEH